MKEIFTSGTYPLPMVSFSPEFPFSLMPDDIEKILVKTFEEKLDLIKESTNKNPWLCDESFGQAFIVSGRKS